jgi:hypothetical protein
VRHGFIPGRSVCSMHSVQKVRALPWREFHAALKLKLSEFGRYGAICVDSPRQVCSGFLVRAKWLAFQSKTSPVRQKVAREELGWGAAWGMSGLHSQRDVIG